MHVMTWHMMTGLSLRFFAISQRRATPPFRATSSRQSGSSMIRISRMASPERCTSLRCSKCFMSWKISSIISSSSICMLKATGSVWCLMSGLGDRARQTSTARRQRMTNQPYSLRARSTARMPGGPCTAATLMSSLSLSGGRVRFTRLSNDSSTMWIPLVAERAEPRPSASLGARGVTAVSTSSFSFMAFGREGKLGDQRGSLTCGCPATSY
mmetsp:Transcript_67011/g.143329  ORF Transcript_67011/g.143329 Transcript_67011/m.143329 type:complete len:212 (+) Transcript_67011:631-1266(+)